MTIDDDSDDRPGKESVVIVGQPETLCYVNPFGQIVVRQRNYPEDDMWVVISVEHVAALVAAIEAAARSPGAGVIHQDDAQAELDFELPPAAPAAPRSRSPTPLDKRAVIKAALRENPERSNRQIAADLGVDHKTVASVRREMKASGEIPARKWGIPQSTPHNSPPNSPSIAPDDGASTNAAETAPPGAPGSPDEGAFAFEEDARSATNA